MDLLETRVEQSLRLGHSERSAFISVAPRPNLDTINLSLAKGTPISKTKSAR